MSGTSIDAVDGALILTDGERVYDIGPVAERKYDEAERAALKAAVDAARKWSWTGPQPQAPFRAAENVLTRTHADAWQQLMADWRGDTPAIAGVHGQTVLHRPPASDVTGRTLQLIDSASLRDALGVPLAYDFRSADVAAGGQGAPLAPAFHAALLRNLGDSQSNAVLNLGGVANITYRSANGDLLAFDTGPANGPIDEWIELHGAGTQDTDGKIAAAGRVDQMSIDLWMDKPWFDLTGPKSLDRFDFDANLARGMMLEDGAATLTAFSAEAVAHAIRQFDDTPDQLIVCGGGRRNPQLMAELKSRVPCTVRSAEAVGWLGDSIEAQAFAYLAVRTMRGLPISWPGTTNAQVAMTGGRIAD